MLPNTLKFLDISHNNIAQLYLDGTSIEEVQANNNQLTMIPSVGNAFFKKINVANNKITEMRIPSEGGCFIFCYYTLAPNIEWIDISNNITTTITLISGLKKRTHELVT